jgi:hypothetical protein
MKIAKAHALILCENEKRSRKIFSTNSNLDFHAVMATLFLTEKSLHLT